MRSPCRLLVPTLFLATTSLQSQSQCSTPTGPDLRPAHISRKYHKSEATTSVQVTRMLAADGSMQEAYWLTAIYSFPGRVQEGPVEVAHLTWERQRWAKYHPYDRTTLMVIAVNQRSDTLFPVDYRHHGELFGNRYFEFLTYEVDRDQLVHLFDRGAVDITVGDSTLGILGTAEFECIGELMGGQR